MQSEGGKFSGVRSCVLFGWRGAYPKVEGMYFAKWRGCNLQSGGAVICKVEGVSKWWGVFYILQGKCYI